MDSVNPHSLLPIAAKCRDGESNKGNGRKHNVGTQRETVSRQLRHAQPERRTDLLRLQQKRSRLRRQTLQHDARLPDPSLTFSRPSSALDPRPKASPSAKVGGISNTVGRGFENTVHWRTLWRQAAKSYVPKIDAPEGPTL